MSKKAIKKISETSTMAGGAVEGASSNDYFIDREKFLEELKLREVIRKVIAVSENKKRNLQEKQEQILRKAIRNLILESETETTPHTSTAINFLEDLLKKVLPVIEDDYKALTTKKEQRDSFRAHYVSSVESSLAAEDINSIPPKSSEGGYGGEFIDIEEDVIEEDEEIEINITDEDKFIDIDPETNEEEEIEEEEVEVTTDTGSKLAAQTFDATENQIIETYSTLSDEEDRKVFNDYLITNIKLYFDKWEKELGDVIEPTTDEYEEEKEETEDETAEAETAEADEEELEL